MDMAKYVAVGVLAVILLATVTYESPAPQPSNAEESRQVTGSFATKPVKALPTTDAVPEPPLESPSEPTAEPSPVDRPAAKRVDTTITLPVSASRELSYVVKAGQTLSDVAGELLGSRGRWREVYEANKDKLPDPDHVVVGMTLTFPSDKVVATTQRASAPRPTPAGERSYTVAKGDTLYSIARAQLGSGSRWKEIAQLNGIDGAGLRAGAQLRLPK